MALEFRKLFATVDDTAREGAEVFVGVFNHGFADGVRPLFAQRLEVVISFDEGPSVVGAFANDACVFPEVLTVFADPDVVGDGVDVHSPRVAESVGPRFGTSARNVEEGVVGRDGVGATVGGVINVDAKEFRVQSGEVLAGVPFVAVAGAIAGGDVEHAVFAEAKREAVMAVGVPFKDEGA